MIFFYTFLLYGNKIGNINFYDGCVDTLFDGQFYGIKNPGFKKDIEIYMKREWIITSLY